MAVMKNLKRTHIIRFVILAVILLVVNIVSSMFHKRFDLTAEKRFSLSDATKKYIGNMKEIANVTIFLQGSLDADFQRLQNRTVETLQEFNEYSGGKIKFHFENPLEGLATPKEKNEAIQAMSQRGVLPVMAEVNQGEDELGYGEKIIFPYALVAHNGREFPVNLIENRGGTSQQEVLNYASSLLEYKFAQAIQKTILPDLPTIAYASGNGQPMDIKTFDMLSTLGAKYHMDTIDLNTNIEVPLAYEALIIVSPETGLDEKAKFKIDQYIMQGGRVLWLVDKLNSSMENMQKSETFLAIAKENNIEDILFKYGVRINNDLIEDVQQNVSIPITMGMIGDRPNIKLKPWLYFPYAIPTSKHPIVHNMSRILFQFANSIDTIATPGIKKTILLHSSNRSRTVPAPVRISLSSLRFPPDPRLYDSKNIPMAVLLEGTFSSNFVNRLAPKFLNTLKDSLNKPFLPEGIKPSKQIVVSSGSVFYNDFSQKNGPMECGYWKFYERSQESLKRFENKSFLLNCIEYLIDDSGLIEARSKDLSLRLLDMPRVRKEKIKWQLVNTALPIILTILFGGIFFYFRKKKYTGKG